MQLRSEAFSSKQFRKFDKATSFYKTRRTNKTTYDFSQSKNRSTAYSEVLERKNYLPLLSANTPYEMHANNYANVAHLQGNPLRVTNTGTNQFETDRMI